MKSIEIIGNVGKDPTYETKDNRGIAKFSVAVTSKKGGEKVTDWFGVTVFGKTADFVDQYVTKGRSVFVRGVPSARYYKNKLEEIVPVIDITANDVELTDKRSETEQGTATTPAGFVQVNQNEELPF